MNTQAYIQSRYRDYSNLTKEVAEAPKFGQGRDLGYCMLFNSTVVSDDGTFECANRDEALALILQKFW